MLSLVCGTSRWLCSKSALGRYCCESKVWKDVFVSTGLKALGLFSIQRIANASLVSSPLCLTMLSASIPVYAVVKIASSTMLEDNKFVSAVKRYVSVFAFACSLCVAVHVGSVLGVFLSVPAILYFAGKALSLMGIKEFTLYGIEENSKSENSAISLLLKGYCIFLFMMWIVGFSAISDSKLITKSKKLFFECADFMESLKDRGLI